MHALVCKWVLLARLRDQPRKWSYRLNETIWTRLLSKNGAALSKYVHFIASQRRQRALVDELHAANADAQHLAREVSAKRLLTMAKCKMYERRIPIDYILGWTPFLGLRIAVRSPILIPRRDTERWVTSVSDILRERRGLRILEVGTGSGCISIGLAKLLPTCHFTAVDISRRAIALAKYNSKGLGASNVAFKVCNVFDANLEGFDMIISNPPYIPQSKWSGNVAPSVRRWEWRRALIGDRNAGIAFHRRLLELARLIPGREGGIAYPKLTMEFDGTIAQKKIILELGRQHGFTLDRIHRSETCRGLAISFV